MKEKGEEEQGEYCNSTIILPGEILYEILTYVPFDDLLRRCRWVCREWNGLTYDSTLRRLHCERTQSVSGYLIEYLTKNTTFHINFVHSIASSPSSSISLDFMPEMNIRIRASTYHAQGLLCCFSELTHRYYVCKPMTQQWTKIPNPTILGYGEEMAIAVMKSNPLHFKIIRFSQCRNDFLLQYCEIFDSKNWAWRVHSEFERFPYFIHFDNEGEVLLHGSFHWLTFIDEQEIIFAFDVYKENWRLIKVPPRSQLSSSSSLEEGGDQEKVAEAMNCEVPLEKILVNCKGHLGVLYTPKLPCMEQCPWIEVWVMEDYLEETSWKKKYRLSLKPLEQIVGWYYILAVDTMDDSITILVRTSDKLIWYNCTTGVLTKVKNLEIPTTTTSIRSIHKFNSDSLPCDLGPK
ncbi:F-box only protein 6-like [Telopea speciosissima]|uniref:F-box only protein 6-like n=1 Tax=Telopea speciosissima TaxID=54955 RepID=UPI001CC79548|nr:F-box only protein 6-like [Telopea speciosissima]